MKIIGIDGGATKVSGAQVIRIDDQTFELIKPIKEIQYKDHKSYDSNFAPFTLEEQLANKELTSTEQNQSQLYIECIT